MINDGILMVSYYIFRGFFLNQRDTGTCSTMMIVYCFGTANPVSCNNLPYFTFRYLLERATIP